jgi:hypothetical protein
MSKFDENLNEGSQNSRYSVEVNFDTTKDDCLISYAKIMLGYISAAMKKMNYHVKLIFSQKPLRLIVASRNWDDGEWVGMVSYNEQKDHFTISKGFYNKLNKTVSVEETKILDNPINAKILSHKLRDMMKDLEGTKDRFVPSFRKMRFNQQ